MEIRHSDYGDDLFFIGGDGEYDDAGIEQQLILEGVEKWEVVERREAEASDTNTNKDLAAFSRMFSEYETVEYVRTRTPR